MKKRLKSFGKDAMVLTATGVGLGVGASVVGSAGGNVAAIGTLSKGMTPIASLTVAKHTIGILGDVNKDIKKKMRY
jgi:hypothetical protein